MMTPPDDDMLNELFAQARDRSTVPADDLVARVLADADAVQAGFDPAPRGSVAPGLWAGLLAGLGGWPAVSGLAAATVAGLWIGIAPPASVEALTATFLGDQVSLTFFPTELGLAAEGISDG